MITLSAFQKAYALPPAGATKFGVGLKTSDLDSLNFCTYEIAKRMDAMLEAAIKAAGLVHGSDPTTDAVLQQAAGNGVMGMYGIDPVPVEPYLPTDVGLWIKSGILYFGGDKTFQSGDLTLVAKKGQPVQINAVMGQLFARLNITPRINGEDKNVTQINGGTEFAMMVTIPTSFGLNIDDNSPNSIVPGGFWAEPFCVSA